MTDWYDGRFGGQPALAWTGSGYGTAWREGAQIGFVRLDEAGEVVEPFSRTAGTSAGSPDVVWTGDQYAVAWEDGRNGRDEIYFARFDSGGVQLGPDVRVTDAPGFKGFPSLVWTGSEFAVAWSDQRSQQYVWEVYFTRIDGTGVELGDDLRLTDDDGITSGSPSLTWNGSEFAVAWSESGPDAAIRFVRLDTTGVPIDDAVDVTRQAAPSSLTWTGSGYAMVWSNDVDEDGATEIWFTRMDSLGGKLGSDERLSIDPSHAQQPSLAWSGTEFGAIWVAETGSGPMDLRFARISAEGIKIGDTAGLSDVGFYAPELVWTGTRYGVVQVENGATHQEIGFTTVDCECYDEDEDGVPTCRGDCDDANPAVHSGALEICNWIDDDCDEMVDEDESGEDTDGDGVGNLCDNCPLDANPAQENHDDDPNGDACDDDDDNDLVFDLSDNCPWVPNPTQFDDDVDGLGNACDNCPGVVNPSQSDTDTDRIGDACDNCVTLPNPSQSDTDADAEGDHCDLDDGIVYIRLPRNDRVEWQVEIGYDAWNAYRGDLAILRTSGLYTQEPGTNPLAERWCDLASAGIDDPLPPQASSCAFFLVTGIASGVEGDLGHDAAGALRTHANPCP